MHPIDSHAKSDVETHLVLFSPLVMFAGQLMYLVTTFAIYWFFKDVVPPENLKLWIWIAVCGLSLSLAFLIVFAIRRPGPEETLRVWRNIDKRLTHIFDLIAVSTIFLLFPHGEEKHHLVALAFIVGYGPTQLIVDPENMWANRISIVTVLSSYAAQLWLGNNPAALILSVLFILYGAMLIFAADTFRNAVRAAVREKNLSLETENRVRVAFDEMSRSRDAKTRFIANASHDLGQPLQAANLFAQQITSKDPSIAHGLQQSVTQALGMVKHMLHFLRLESDSVKANIVPLDVSALLHRAVEMLMLQARDQKIELVFVGSSIRVLADENLLKRVLDNLISNSIHHSGASRILVGVRPVPKTKLVKIWVIDNGVGVPSGEQERVFEDYEQGSNSKPGGFGLGLSSVRRILQLLGGKAKIDPRWRHGCAVFVELPRA